MGPHHWSKVPTENQTSDPNGLVQQNWPARQMGSTVRGLMATAACARDDRLGLLVATLGANNVYSVSTNEGLLDPATQINGLTPAITKPFALRLAFGAALAAASTNVPHLKVDGFDCGPILRRDATALADGDLVALPPVWVLGEFAAAGDTKVTRVRVLDYVPSDISAIVAAALAGVTGFPIGGILPFTGTDIPTGFIIANGPILSRASYPKLWAHAQASDLLTDDGTWLGYNGLFTGFYSTGDNQSNFRVPAINGTFLRAFDYNRGLDPGRNMGMIQSDAFRSHGHGLTGGGLALQLYGNGPAVYLAGSDSPNISVHAVNIAAAGDAETRPVNVAYPFLIRAY